MTFLFRPVLAILLTVLLTGCIPDYTKTSPAEVAKSVKVKDTKFDKYITYVAPRMRYQEDYYSNVYHYHFLRGWKDKKTGFVEHQLYVQTHYTAKEYIPSSFKEEDKVKIIEHANDWRIYRTASFEDATQVNLVSINTDVGCELRDIIYECDYKETIGVPITAELLGKSSILGFTVRLNAKSGHKNFITIPPNYIQGYISALSSGG